MAPAPVEYAQIAINSGVIGGDKTDVKGVQTFLGCVFHQLREKYRINGGMSLRSMTYELFKV